MGHLNEKDAILYEIDPDRANQILKDKKKRAKKAEKETKAYMNSVKEFLTIKGGGQIPPEWQMSLQLLQTYYKQWLLVSLELEETGEYTTLNGVGTTIESPLIGIQNKCATRLEKQMQELGLSLKSGKKLDVVDVKKAVSPLDAFLNKEVEKR